MEEKTGEIPSHTHCRSCAKAIPSDKTFCSEECKQRYLEAVKKQRKTSYIMFGILIALVVGAFVIMLWSV